MGRKKKNSSDTGHVEWCDGQMNTSVKKCLFADVVNIPQNLNVFFPLAQ